MYCSISLSSSRVMELMQDLSRPGSRIAQYATTLTMRDSIPWLLLPRLLRALLRVRSVHLEDNAVAYNTSAWHPPTNLRLVARMLIARPAPSLRSLRLSNVSFSSSSDVIRLLASLSQLTEAVVFDCFFLIHSTDIPSTKSTCLRHLNVHVSPPADDNVFAISSLTHWWRWPHLYTTKAYPGLRNVDARSVDALLVLLSKAFTGKARFE